MNGTVLSDVTKVAGNISPWSVIVLQVITIVAAVGLITLGNFSLSGLKKWYDRHFSLRKDEDSTIDE